MVSSEKHKPRRGYELKKRARRREETRRRITEAAVELHGTVGPAQTTVSDVARLAGVRRMTVYNHFPTDAELFSACSSHWFARNPPPDAEAWRRIRPPHERLVAALGELYGYYRRSERMLANVMRDAPLIPALGALMEERWKPLVEGMVAVLADGYEVRGGTGAFHATLLLTLDFHTWRTLVGSGLADDGAARLSARLVGASAAG